MARYTFSSDEAGCGTSQLQCRYKTQDLPGGFALFGLCSARADTRTILQRLYSDQRWCLLTQAFRRAIYTLHSLPHLPLLHYALSAGLTALKLPACITEEPHPSQPSHLSELPFSSSNAMLSSSDLRSDSPSKVPNPDCPVCDTACLGVLAHEVPFSHHANSTIVCRISGKIMTTDNPPLAFENGMVYSEQVSSSDVRLKNFVSSAFTNIGASGNGQQKQWHCQMPSNRRRTAARDIAQGFRLVIPETPVQFLLSLSFLMIYSFGILSYFGSAVVYMSTIRI